MDEQKIINVSDNTVNDLLKHVTTSCYNNGYINGCVDGIKAGKKAGKRNGLIIGIFFSVITAVAAYFSCKLFKGMVKEAADICSSNKNDSNFTEIKEEQVDENDNNFTEIKEEQDGSESVQEQL